MAEQWQFVHAKAGDAAWSGGLRDIFDYRDLGIRDATNGDYVAHIIKANGRESADAVQQWHVHDCDFQMVLVLAGWADFEYEGQGVHHLAKGDCVLQPPGIRHREIACSADFEVLEVVSPANFGTRTVAGP